MNLFHLSIIFNSLQQDMPDGDDSDDGVPPASLARSSSRRWPSTPLLVMGWEGPHLTPSLQLLTQEEDPKSLWPRLTSAAEENTKDKGRKTLPGQEELVLERPVSSAPTTLVSLGQQGAPSAPLTEDGAKKTPPSMHGLEGTELVGRQQGAEAALNSSALLPEHHAILGMAFTQFWSTEARILDAFLGLAKGF